MKTLRETIRHLILEGSHEAKLASLLTSVVHSAIQAAQLGEPLDLVRDFDHYPLPFDEAHIIEVCTSQALADLIKNAQPADLIQKQLPDGWVQSSYTLPATYYA